MGKYFSFIALLALSLVCHAQINKSRYSSHSSDSYTLQGAREITNRNYLQAIESLSKAISINPEHKLAYQFRGEAYVRLKSYELALKDFAYAIELDAGDAQLYVKRGRIFEYLGQTGHARADYLQCLLIEPDFPEAKALLAAIDQQANYPSYPLAQEDDIWEQQMMEIKESSTRNVSPARSTVLYRTRVIRRDKGILYARVAAHLESEETEIKLLSNRTIEAFHEGVSSIVKLIGQKPYPQQQGHGVRKIEHRFNVYTQLHEYRLLGFPTLDSSEDRLTLEVITPKDRHNWSIDIALLGIGGVPTYHGR